jgi:TolB-like protein
VAVLPFSGDRGDVLSDIFTTELMKLHLFDIVGSATLEQGRHMAGEAPQGSSEEEGEAVSPSQDLTALSDRFNLDAVITGNVAIDFNMLVINTRLMEMETGNLLWSTSYICECGRVNVSDLEEAVRDTVEELERALSAGP